MMQNVNTFWDFLHIILIVGPTHQFLWGQTCPQLWQLIVLTETKGFLSKYMKTFYCNL